MGRIGTRPMPALALLVACALALGACATTGGAGERHTVSIHVENTLSPPASLTLWIVPELDTRQVLGTVAPGGEQAFSYTVGVAGRYQLLAETSGGPNVVSRRFSIPGDTETVSWNLSTNTVHLH